MFSRKEMELRREAGITSPNVKFSKELTIEVFKIAKLLGGGYVYKMSYPKSYKQKSLYVGQSSRLDPKNLNTYLGLGNETHSDWFDFFNQNKSSRTIEKTIIGFAYCKEDLNKYEEKTIKKLQPLYNKIHNDAYIEKNKKRFLAKASDFIPIDTNKTNTEKHSQKEDTLKNII